MSRVQELPDHADVVVVGAGPAGMAATAVTASAGLSTLLLDENPAVGGQIYRAITSTPLQRRSILGPDYWRGAALVRALRASKARHVPGATVWSLEADRTLGVSIDGVARRVTAKRVILATGALERPFPVPGWTLPGVMTVGAAQGLLKTSALVPEGRVVIAGTGPLLWLYAAQVLAAGGNVQAILETTEAANRRRALTMLPAFIVSPYLTKGLALLARVRRKVRVVTDVTALAAEGDERLAAVTYTGRGGRSERMPADVLLLHQGVVPHTNLAMAAGVPHVWDEVQRCWVPVVDAYGTTALDGVAIAGDGAGIGGAEMAVGQGRLAGLAAVRAIGRTKRPQELPDEHAIRSRQVGYLRGRAFLDILYRPPAAFRVPTGDTIVCRCEEVRARDITDLLAKGVEGPLQVKAMTRCGMGPCQGRNCALTVTEVIAAQRGVAPSDVGTWRLRPPVKPVSLGALAAMEKPAAAVAAVVRE
jgi:thioredoxin reductase/bacterioferritin-associated ferredoxin